MAVVKSVIFKLADNYFGVDIGKVIAIEQKANIVPVPNAVRFVEGLINIRGEVIPVYSLRARNGIDNTTALDDVEYIIVWCNGEKLALCVDVVKEIKDIKEDCYQDLPVICSCEDNKYITGIAHIDDILAIIIDVDSLLSQAEMDNLSKIIE